MKCKNKTKTNSVQTFRMVFVIKLLYGLCNDLWAFQVEIEEFSLNLLHH